MTHQIDLGWEIWMKNYETHNLNMESKKEETCT